MAVAKYKIVRKCPVCGEKSSSQGLWSPGSVHPNAPRWRGSVSMMKKKRQLELDKIVKQYAQV